MYPAASQFIAQCPEMGPKYCTPPILKYLDVYKQSAPHSPIVCIIRCWGKAVVLHTSQNRAPCGWWLSFCVLGCTGRECLESTYAK